jgi:Lysylphosphatidylglycerol synthase TM region
MRDRVKRLRRWCTQHPKAITLTASVVVGGAVAVGLAGKQGDFASAVGDAPIWILSVAVCLHVIWLVARSEAWHVCVGAAGGTVGRRRLYRAASVGYLGNLFNAQFGLGVRIAALRRSAPAESPEPAVLVAAELPIVLVEGALAALMSFTLIAPLGVPWWVPLVALAVMGAAIAGGGYLARDRRQGAWRGLAVLRGLANRNRVIALVVLAVSIQVARNWFLLHAVGVDISVLDAVTLLIAMAVVGLLPIGPSAGAATTVVILGANGIAAAAAAGALLTLTGVLATLAFAGWAFFDRMRPAAVPLPAPSA